MSKTVTIKEKAGKSRFNHLKTLTTPAVPDEELQKWVNCSLEIENSHSTKIFCAVMEKLTTSSCIVDIIGKFKILLKQINKIKRIQDKYEDYMCRFDLGLRKLCNNIIKFGRIKDAQFNIILYKQDVNKFLIEVLVDMKEDIAGISHPFEMYNLEIAEETIDADWK